MPEKVEISHRTIVFTVFFLLLLWLLFQIRHILVIFFIGVIFMASLNPLVERLERLRLPRTLAIAFVYLFIFGFVGVILAGVIPPLLNQSVTLVNRMPDVLKTIGISGVDERIISQQLGQYLKDLEISSGSLLRTTVGLFGNFIVIFTLIFISFYLLLERKNLDVYLLKLFGKQEDRKIASIIEKIEKRLGDWARAELTLMIIVGAMSYIGLRFLGIEFALPLALLAGILEAIPNIGPVISAIPAVLAGLLISPLMALAVAALYFLVQQLENNLIVPQIMAKEVGINPLIALLALIAGFKIGGAIGAVLAIPFVVLAETILKEFFASKSS